MDVSMNSRMLLAILPQIGVFLLGCLILALDLSWNLERRRWLAWITAAGLWMIMLAMCAFSMPSAEGTLIFGGMLRHDMLSFVFTQIVLFGGSLTVLLAKTGDHTGNRGEYYLLMLVSILGMTLMAGASDLIMLFLAIETTSIPLYVLAGFLKGDDASTEAGMKYLLFGAMTSAVLLYGFSLIYGFAGTTQIYAFQTLLTPMTLSIITITGTIILVLIGLSFKVSAFPFHFWAPDVYQGAPTPITAFLSTASKAAGFAVLLRLFTIGFGNASLIWALIIALLSTATMFVGNLLALRQTNIKRLLAYSSIAHAGYMLIGVSVIGAFGVSSVIFYLITYLVTNIAAFAIVTLIGAKVGSDEISAYAGLSRRSPGLALALLASFLSLAGIPPFAGFTAKFMIFSAAVDAGRVWLVVLAVINAVIGLYYYLNVLKVVYLDHSEGEAEPLPVPRTIAIPLVLCVIGILAIGVVFAPWFEFSRLAAVTLF